MNESRRTTSDLEEELVSLRKRVQCLERSEEAWKSSSERLRILFEHAPDAIYLHDLDGVLVDGNRAAEELTGYRREELIGKSLFALSLLSPDQMVKAAASVSTSASDKPTGPEEYRLRRKDGGEVAVEIRTYPLNVDGRRIVLGIAHDISARKKTAQENILLAQTVKSARDCISITDLEDRIIFVNESFLTTYGYCEQELLGKNISMVRSSTTTRGPATGVHPATRGDGWHGELMNRRKDGHEFSVELWTSPVKDSSGSAIAMVGIARDITDRKRAEAALRESEEQYRDLIEKMPDGVYKSSHYGKFIEVNPAMVKTLGYDSKEELLAIDIKSQLYFAPSDRESAALEEKLEEMAVFRLKKKDGSEIWVEDHGRHVVDEQGNILYHEGILRDVSERKRAEEVIQESELRFRSIFESAGIGIALVDMDGCIIRCNLAVQAMLGYSEEELAGMHFAGLTCPDDLQKDLTFYRELMEGKRDRYQMEKGFLRKDGQRVSGLLNVSLVRNRQGKPLYALGLVEDISERKRGEEKLRRSEEQFRLISENVADMISVLDVTGKRLYNSPSYRDVLGDPLSLRGTDSFREIHPEDRERISAAFAETVRTGVGQRMEYRFLLSNGSIRHIESQGSVVRDRDGKVTQVIVVSRDVTEKRIMERQFLRAQRMESLGTLAGGIAHDLNNVLAPIMMSIEVLRAKLPGRDEKRLFDTLSSSAQRGSDIIRQVLAFGRGLTGERVILQPRHIIREVERIAEQTFPKSIEISTDLPRDLWAISADPTQMRQVLLNVCVNARDAMPRGGRLTMTAENLVMDKDRVPMGSGAEPGPYVVVSVSDTGTGIPAEVIEKIFEPFFTTKDIGHGTGLGLSTTLAIVKSHGGIIDVSSQPGKGTTFKIFIPARIKEKAESTEEEDELPPGQGELILVVDDEASIREITTETLMSHGYTVISASDGSEAVAAYIRHRKDVKAVVTDMMMPVMDGAATIRALRRMDPAVRIIAVSGLTVIGDDPQTPASGATAVLGKPFTTGDLLRSLRAVLGRT